MKNLGAAQWIFSLKLFVAAMIAYVLSVRMALPQSYWAVVTCCVVMNPTTGAIRSKAVFRFTGTLCAGIAALLLASAFASVPLLLIVSAGLVATTAFGWALLDRTPRSYGFQLFGITLMIIAVAGVDHPENMFNTAVARICEIGLGIVCCTVVDSIIAPRSLSRTLRERLDLWLPDMAAWIDDAFHGRVRDDKAERDRQTIIADVAAMSVLATQLRYDPTVGRWERQCVLAIQHRLLRLIPLLSAIAAHIAAQRPSERDALAPWLQDAAKRARDGAGADNALAESMGAAPSDQQSPGVWQGLLHENLAMLVTDVLRIWSEVHQIHASLGGRGVPDAALQNRVRQARAFPLQPDFHIAGRVAGGILLAYSLLCTLWWATGWPQGPNAVLMGIVAVAFFGSLDEAGKAIANFARFSAMALVLAGILSYGLLPLAQDFPSFAIIMGLILLPLGAVAATNPLAILLLALALSTINLQAQYNPADFGSFLESSFSTLLGIYVAFMSIGLVRRMGASHTVQRYARLQRDDVVQLTRRASTQDRDDYINRSLDRIAGATTRLGAASEVDQSTRLLSWLRVGIAVAVIRQASAQLGGETRQAANALLAAIRDEVHANEFSAELLQRIDHTLAAAWRAPTKGSRPLMRGLIGLRLALFERSPAWEPTA